MHSFRSSSQFAPFQPGLHPEHPTTGSQVRKLVEQIHRCSQFTPHVPGSHSYEKDKMFYFNRVR